jgi:hypothetical protein
MKNIYDVLILTTIMFFVVGNISLVAAAEITDTETGSTLEFSLSPNVEFDYSGEASSGTAGDPVDQYALITWNSQGTKGYGFQHNYEGVLITKVDLDDGGTFTAPTNPGVAGWSADDWMILGNPSEDLPDVLVTEDETTGDTAGG